jgi:phage terminase large subunit-like protein
MSWDPLTTPDSPDRLDALVWGLTELMCNGNAPALTGKLQAVPRRFGH